MRSLCLPLFRIPSSTLRVSQRLLTSSATPRWRAGGSTSLALPGWMMDTVAVSTEPTAEPAPKGRAVLWLLVLVVPLVLLVAWWPAPPKPRPALPSPNGYDYFVKSVGSLAGMWTNQSLSTVAPPDLAAFLIANAASLQLAKEGLQHKCHTLVNYDGTYISRSMENVVGFKSLARLLAGEGRSAEYEGKLNAASTGYLDTMQFGQECSRGGVMIERLVGVAAENIGLTEVRRLLPSLPAQEVQNIMSRLQKLDASHDPPAVNLEAEAEWVKCSFSLWEQFMHQIHPTMRKNFREVRDNFTSKVNALQVARRSALVEAAARLFELEKGRRPTGYADLVPAYLPTTPLDPTTGKPIAHPF